jgi:hypothetical protein
MAAASAVPAAGRLKHSMSSRDHCPRCLATSQSRGDGISNPRPLLRCECSFSATLTRCCSKIFLVFDRSLFPSAPLTQPPVPSRQRHVSRLSILGYAYDVILYATQKVNRFSSVQDSKSPLANPDSRAITTPGRFGPWDERHTILPCEPIAGSAGANAELLGQGRPRVPGHRHRPERYWAR